ncbi:hypothetical protein M433DRAFT_157614 [Acidomyces richmondensis BFW]|nr:MAG: hypothetical protein FE78DRAFT_93634 [Acidomyces sp. 'richmondensis']KYG42687.1 hypothetical protein M433DRAFT_157614 [Acidomyces richmondensis BFW]
MPRPRHVHATYIPGTYQIRTPSIPSPQRTHIASVPHPNRIHTASIPHPYRVHPHMHLLPTCNPRARHIDNASLSQQIPGQNPVQITFATSTPWTCPIRPP